MSNVAASAVVVLALLTGATPHVELQTIPPAARVVLAGDSIADGGWQGGGATPADRIADRMWGEDHTGMSTVTEGGMCLVASGCVGDPLTDRWAGILASAPTTVIVLAGTNDLTRVTGQQLLDAYGQLYTQAEAAGIRVLICTIPPRSDSEWRNYWYWGPKRESTNAALRMAYPQDVVDVAAVLERGDTWADDAWMRPGDPIHPSWIGAVRISDAVPLGRIL